MMTTARRAGLAYAVIIVCGLFAEIVVRGSILVAGDAVASARNMRAHESLFLIGIAADTVMVVADISVAILFFFLFKQIDRTLAIWAAVLRLIQAATIIAAAIFVQYGALSAAFDGLDDLASRLMDTHAQGYDLALLFFGASCLVLGRLVTRTPIMPSALGLGLFASGAVYVAGGLIRFLAPTFLDAFKPTYIIPLAVEVAFCLWLLVKGGQVRTLSPRP